MYRLIKHMIGNANSDQANDLILMSCMDGSAKTSYRKKKQMKLLQRIKLKKKRKWIRVLLGKKKLFCLYCRATEEFYQIEELTEELARRALVKIIGQPIYTIEVVPELKTGKFTYNRDHI